MPALVPRKKRKILQRLRLRKGPKAKDRPHVKHKRAHRSTLASRADAHWRAQGEPERAAHLAKIRAALEQEGFRSTPFQWRHKGQAFGLVKDLGEKQVHVRVYDNGVIDAELELHKRYVQHLYSKRPSAHRTIQRLFAKHRIPLDFVNEHYLPQVGATRTKYPRGRLRVAHVLGGVGAVAGAVLVTVARFQVARRKRSWL